MRFLLVLCALVAMCAAGAVREKRGGWGRGWNSGIGYSGYSGGYGGYGGYSGYSSPIYVQPVSYGYYGGGGHGYRGGYGHGYSGGYGRGYGHGYRSYGGHGGW